MRGSLEIELYTEVIFVHTNTTRRHCDREGSARDTSVIVILSTREKEREGGDVEVAQERGIPKCRTVIPCKQL